MLGFMGAVTGDGAIATGHRGLTVFGLAAGTTSEVTKLPEWRAVPRKNPWNHPPDNEFSS